MGKPRTLNQNGKKKSQEYNNDLRSLWDKIKCESICVIEVPEGGKGEQEVEKLLEEIMIENFPHLVREIDIQPQEAQRVPRKKNPKGPTPRHIIIKMPKTKNLKSERKATREHL